MRAGDNVIYLPDPLLYGTGIIERTLPNGRIVARFQDGQDETFHPQELELLNVWREG
jgi:hypothetical protein